jgi:hypothetical protein
MRALAMVGLALALPACGGDRWSTEPPIGTSKPESPHVPRDEPSAIAPALTTEPTATSTPSSPHASATPPDLRQPEIGAAFLPHDGACQADTDCAATRFGVGPRFTCCDPCDSAAGTKAWVKRADAKCEAMHRASQVGVCPPRDCASLRAKCVSGQCVPAI